MADLQKIYDSCIHFYDDCYDIVDRMSSGIKEIMESEGMNYDPEVTVIKFDILLQYSLLQIASADYEIDRNELIFIRDLTKKGDIVNYLNTLSDSQISWDDIYQGDILDLRGILDSIKDRIKKLSKEFVMVFATCDLATEHNYLADLTRNINCIIVGLAAMDGEITSTEMNSDCLILKALDEIKKIKCQ